jgi:hypothetical protein
MAEQILLSFLQYLNAAPILQVHGVRMAQEGSKRGIGLLEVYNLDIKCL